MTTYHRAVAAQLAVLLLVIGAAPLFAQSTATIVGVVRDSGGVLPGATVTVRNVDTGLTRSVPTGEDGAYRFPALPVGPYEIRAELSGFRTTVRSGVRLPRRPGSARPPGRPVGSDSGNGGGPRGNAPAPRPPQEPGG